MSRGPTAMAGLEDGMHRGRASFLIVDDDEVAVMAVERALDGENIARPVAIARSGAEALNLLRRPGAVRRPCLVLLDLNMPGMSGLEMLAELRRDPALAPTVVFVLTTSDSPQDIAAAYALNAAGYLLKGQGGRTVRAAVRLLDLYARTALLPE